MASYHRGRLGGSLNTDIGSWGFKKKISEGGFSFDF